MKKIILFIFSVLLIQLASGQWIQMGSDIDGEAAGDFSGWSVSVSADGNRSAIGAGHNDGSDSNAGHVRVYEFEGMNWVQLGQDIDGEAANDQSGQSVSLSSNGNRVAIGARYNDGNGNSSGHVRVYEFDGMSWIQLGQDIDGEASGDHCGDSVSLSSDGNRVAIGAPDNDGNGANSGHVRVYEYDGITWNQLGQDIDGEVIGDYFGDSVDLSSNGNRVAIGTGFNDGNGANSGHVRVYEYDGITWNQLGQDIDGEAAGDHFGDSVSLSADGGILAVGAFWNDGNGSQSGHVRVYEYDGITWNQLGQDIDGEAAGDHFGLSVSLSADGSTLAVGAPSNDGTDIDSGHARAYEFDGVTWNQLGQDINGEAADDQFGLSVSLSADGNTIVVGANVNDGNGNSSGHARVYGYNDPYTPIPDPNFEQALIDQGIDSEATLDGQVLTSDISGLTSLNVDNLGITDLTGIEDFAALVNLNCSMNQLGSLDMSANGNLLNLNCGNNQLTSLDVSNSSNLRRLYCQNNQLTSLNVSGNTVLRGLYCQGNQFTDLDVTDLLLLGVFNGSNNPMLSCIAVDDPASAAAQLGLYDDWVVDDLMVYSNSCGMMAKAGDLSNIKNTENNDEGKEEIKAGAYLKLYPNPVQDRLHIAVPEGESIVRITICNLHGEKVLTTTSGSIDMEGFPEGLYVVAIQTDVRATAVYKKMVISGR